MKKKLLLILVALVLATSFTLPAWASNNWYKTLEGNIQKVWIWNGLHFAVGRTEDGSTKILIKRRSYYNWDKKIIFDNIDIFDEAPEGAFITGVALTPEKMYLSLFDGEENKLFYSTDGKKWRSDGLNAPRAEGWTWIAALDDRKLLANVDRGTQHSNSSTLMHSKDGGESWNYQISGSAALWDNVTAAGDRVFAVLNNELKYSDNLNSWQDTGFKINKTVTGALNDYFDGFVSEFDDKYGGRAVVSIDYHDDKTVVAFNPATAGSVTISRDGGDSWAIVDSDNFKWDKSHAPAKITAVAVSDDVIFAGTFDDRVFYSTDQGATWSFIEINGDVLDLAINEDNVVLAGTDRGVYQMDWDPKEVNQPEDDNPQDDTVLAE